MQTIDLRRRIDGKGEVLPADPPVLVRPGVRFAGGEEDQFRLAVPLPGDRAVRVLSGEAERVQHRMKLRNGVGQVVNGDAEMIKNSHAVSFADAAKAVEIARQATPGKWRSQLMRSASVNLSR